MRFSKIAICAALGTSLALASCASYETEVASVGFHAGHAKANQKILLSNIIRASFGWGPTFVAANEVTSSTKAEASLSATINVGPDAPSAHGVTPSLGGSRQQTVKTIDYGASEAAEFIYRGVSQHDFRDLANRGWPTMITYTLLLASVTIDRELITEIIERNENFCQENKGKLKCKTKKYYESVHVYGEKCIDKNVVYSRVFNKPTHRCEFVRFQNILNRLRLVGMYIITTSVGASNKPGSNNNSNSVEIRFRDAFIQTFFERIQAERDYPVLLFSVRSTAEMIKFLGEISAVQLHSEAPYVPEVIMRSPVSGAVAKAPLFVVCRRGDEKYSKCETDNGSANSAVTASVAGHVYYVPMPDPLSANRARSVALMSYIMELLNRAQSQTEVVTGLTLFDPD